MQMIESENKNIKMVLAAIAKWLTKVNRNKEDRKTSKSNMQWWKAACLRWKITRWDWLWSDIAKEKISEPDDTVVRIVKNETQREKTI